MAFDPALRPHTTVVLAISADGKIADVARSPARFGSAADKAHLEAQIALADGVLFGAGTLRAYGTTLPVTNPALLQQRQDRGQPAQPVQIVASRSGNLDKNWRFFSQPIPRWLITNQSNTEGFSEGFERVILVEGDRWNWLNIFQELADLGLRRLVVSGGGNLVAALLEANLIDEFWITVCPLILGSSKAPTLVDGLGFKADQAPRLELLEVKAIASEVFLHYAVQPLQNP